MKGVLRAVNRINILLISIFSLSCINDREPKDKQIIDSVAHKDTMISNAPYSKGKLWIYDPVADSMIKKQIPADLSVEMVLKEINANYAEGICVDYIKTSNDTVFLKIDDASILTQRMGTTGAFTYMSELIYSLTEVFGIHFVAIDFEEGDHAAPGIYKRSDFKRESN